MAVDVHVAEVSERRTAATAAPLRADGRREEERKRGESRRGDVTKPRHACRQHTRPQDDGPVSQCHENPGLRLSRSARDSRNCYL